MTAAGGIALSNTTLATLSASIRGRWEGEAAPANEEKRPFALAADSAHA
jgi:hypothetical protein